MESIMNDIWPSLLGALLAAIGLYAGYIRKLIVDVAVLSETVTNQQKIIDSMTKRLDSHSKKQDEIYNTLTGMKVEMLKEIGKMSMNIGALSSDVRSLNNLLAITDAGIVIKREK